ncbi:MAG TPA: EI24 domain-containing protein [Rickettsiales bacterium]|nr:EI24 domain-containing protein [Rickettsiales bacterium]
MLTIIFAKSLRNLLLPEILKLFLLCLLAYVIGGWILVWIISGAISTYIGVTGAEGFFVHMLGSAGGMMIAWFLFPLLYPILVNFFDDSMAEVIERKDYPGLPPAQPPFWPTMLGDVLFSLKALGLNLLCLPLYFMPLFGMLLYYGLNGYLLGTQFFRMAAGRRVNAQEAVMMEQKARYSIWGTGVAISICATIPLLNLASPLIGVASMLHLFHALRGTKKQQVLLPEQ